eukprot:g6052.t1
MSISEISYLNQSDAVQLDKDLMGELRFGIDQLMELAGLSVASAIHQEYSPENHPRVLVISGPGNNGGDGLVVARHLTLFGHTVQICVPLPTNNLLFDNLHKQCEAMGVRDATPGLFIGGRLRDNFDLVVDAIFGFSFRGRARAPFDKILQELRPDRNPPTLVSVDIPSGWNVEEGDVEGDGIQPDMLVSLSAPKLCAKKFKGTHHYLGGRFLPPSIMQKFNLNLPPYPRASQCVKLSSISTSSRLRDMRVDYQTANLDESEMLPDPFAQFQLWFDEYSALKANHEANAISIATCGTDGRPSVRMVLLKGLNKNGFIFFTNYTSKKGKQLTQNQHAAMCLHMECMRRQVRIEGIVEKLSDAESDDYFHSRPRSSQLGAWTSDQSTVIANRQVLEKKLAAVEDTYRDASKSVPRPSYWGGYVLIPDSIEFWQGGTSRLHDRLEYQRDGVGTDWVLHRLSP